MRKDIYNDLHVHENTHWWHVYKRKVLDILLRTYVSKQNGTLKILDAGCGTGGTLLFLQKYGNVVGVDSDKNALLYCKNLGIETVHEGDVERLKYKNQFDLVTLLEVLEHVDEDRCLNSVCVALKKGGKVLITVPAYQWMWSNWDVIIKHKKRYTQKDLEGALNRHGFRIIKTSYLYSFLVIPAFIIRTIKDYRYGKNYPSDFNSISSSIINNLMKIVCTLEFFFFRLFTIPFGLSVICVAQKK